MSFDEPVRFAVRKDSEKSVTRIRAEGLTQSNLSNLFGFVARSISLVSEEGDAETADEFGQFPTSAMRDSVVWRCRGTPLYSSHRSTLASHSSAASSGRRAASTSLVGTMPPSAKRRRAEPPKALLTVEVCTIEAAPGRRKPKIVPFSTFSINVDPDDCTVFLLSRRISNEAFCGRPVVLLNNHNLKHMDTPATRSEYNTIMYHSNSSLLMSQSLVVTREERNDFLARKKTNSQISRDY